MLFHLGTDNTLAETMRSAGFTGVEVSRLTTTLHYASPDEACGAAFEPWRSGRAFAVPGEFVVACGFA
jgi:hypothetical protein